MSRRSSSLLINEQPLQVIPSLACKMGLNRAMFLQQLHYWLQKPGAHVRDGKRWIFNTFEEWHEQFPFWTAEGIRKIVSQLESKGIVETTDRYNTRPGDRTKWYTIDYEKLNALFDTEDESLSDDSAPDKSTVAPNHPDKSTEQPDKSTEPEPDKSTELYQRVPESNHRDSELHSGDGSSEPAPKNEVKPKAQSPGNYGVAQLMERHSAAKKANRNPLPLPERDRRQYGDWYAAYLRDGSESEDLKPVLDYLIARACGEVENEKKAWIGFGTAFDSVANSTANVATSFYERQQHSADKPRKPQWYMAFYGGSPDYYQSLIDEGYGHDDILEAVVSSEAVNVAV